jgi:hypothetical protein
MARPTTTPSIRSRLEVSDSFSMGRLSLNRGL